MSGVDAAVPLSRLCCRCGQPASRYTFRPTGAPAYQEWCERHAPAGALPLAVPEDLTSTVPDDRPIDLGPSRPQG